jgi:abhydrolase domain-containing protein 4
MNFDDLAKTRPVYSIDILGFGKSSRPNFDKNPDIAEMQFVQSINEWRREMNIRKMILCGHSFGSYLACSYALVYPDHVKHLILNDPWGFPQRPKQEDLDQKYNVPLWVKAIAYAVQPLNPLWLVRASGPFGQWVVEKTRPDIMRKYKSFVKEESAIAQYIHQCNSQNPTGEAAFHSMMESFGWARKPMINRIHEMRDDVPLTLVYGSKSWVDHSSGNIIKNARPKSYVNVHVIHNAGHHVYADQPQEFNSIIVKTCDIADEVGEEEDEKS